MKNWCIIWPSLHWKMSQNHKLWPIVSIFFNPIQNNTNDHLKDICSKSLFLYTCCIYTFWTIHRWVIFTGLREKSGVTTNTKPPTTKITSEVPSRSAGILKIFIENIQISWMWFANRNFFVCHDALVLLKCFCVLFLFFKTYCFNWFHVLLSNCVKINCWNCIVMSNCFSLQISVVILICFDWFFFSENVRNIISFHDRTIAIRFHSNVRIYFVQ